MLIRQKESWNDVSIKAAHDTNTPEAAKGFAVYVASKIEAERAAWRWVEENKPKFAFNTVLPNFTVSSSATVRVSSISLFPESITY